MTSKLTGFGGAYAGKKVLITGHTGFKGSWLTHWLAGLGADVAGYSLEIPTRPSHFEILGLSKRIRHELGDVRDAKRLRAFVREFKPEIAFHLAAQPLVRDSYETPAETFETNVMGTVNFLDAVRSTPSIKTAINVTSDKCYENLETGQPYKETDRLGGKDPYSASKAAAEIVYSSYFQSFFKDRSDIRVATVRAGNVIGGGDWAKDRIVPDCFRAWSRGEQVLTRNPQSVRPWQHVLEPLSGYLWLGARLSREPRLHGEAFNFGPLPESNQTVERLLTEFKKHRSAADWALDGNSDRTKKEAGLLNLDVEKAANLLHWKASLSFDEAIRMTSEWYWTFYGDPGSEAAASLTSEQIQQYTLISAERGQTWAKIDPSQAG